MPWLPVCDGIFKEFMRAFFVIKKMTEYAYKFAAEYKDEETMEKDINEAINKKKEEIKKAGTSGS